MKFGRLLDKYNFKNYKIKKRVSNNMITRTRQPAVAGQFYPSESDAILKQIQNYLKQAPDQKIKDKIKAIIAPHAGYDFSGQTAAYAFKQLAGKKINTVVIIGNSHKAYFDGIAIDSSDSWQTPLGIVEIDKELANKLVAADNSIKYNSSVHEQDHVIEVEIPFLQIVLNNDFKIAPILFGNKNDNSYKKLAQALKNNLKADDLVVISSDMSHYPKYEDANKIDQATLKKLKKNNIKELEKHIKDIENSDYANEQTVLCGIDAVKTALELARLAGWNKIEILKYANSGDVIGVGDKSRVVGYGSVAIAQTENVNELNNEQKKKLLDIVRQTIESYVKNNKTLEFNIIDEKLNQKQGAFVTLTKNNQLRGCIGQIIPYDQPLWKVARDMAIEACSEDNRFNPVSEDELSELKYAVSVLSEPEEIDDWRKIKLGKHGVIIKNNGHSGVFLPQVAIETNWSLEKFLSELCRQKAGLSPSCYKDKDTKIFIFTAQVIK